MARVIAVDPGDRRIGLAVSDPTRTLARPLTTLLHTSRVEDARAILSHAQELEAQLIVVGLALDADGAVGPQARKGQRLVQELRAQGSVPVATWDESGTTERAASLGRTHELDARAAAVLLQEYLDAQKAE